MRKTGLALAVAALAAGCAGGKDYSESSVTRMAPGYAVMVARFIFTPGQSTYPKEQIFKEAEYTVERLRTMSYEPFIVYTGGDTTEVGIRATSYRQALALKQEIDNRKGLPLGDGNTLPMYDTKIKNLAELQLYALDRIP